MRSVQSCLLACLVLAGLAAPRIKGYYHFVHYGPNAAASEALIEKFDRTALFDGTVYFYVSNQKPALAANDSYEALVSQVRQALAVWNNVPTSALRVEYGGVSDGDPRAQSPAGEILFTELPPGVIGLGGPVTRGEASDGFVPIIRSQVILSDTLMAGRRPRTSFSEMFFNSLVHEIGHALGLQHSLASSAMSTDLTRATTRALPLAPDDVAGLSAAYPAAGFYERFGSISGRVTTDRGSLVHLASVVALSRGGLAVSGLTAPDGTYRIEGLLPGSYLLYAHPLPPATQEGLGPANIVPPTAGDGRPIPAGSPFRTVFYGGESGPGPSAAVEVSSGETTAGIDFQVRPRRDVPLHSVTAYSFPGNGAPGVHPAFLNTTEETGFVLVTGQGLAENLSQLRVEPIGASLRVLAPRLFAADIRFARLDFQLSPFDSARGVPLLFRLADDAYVLPNAVRLTSAPAPLVHWMTPRFDAGDNVWSLRGADFDPRSLVYFDGLPARILETNAGAGEIIFEPPPGPPGHQAVVTVYNPDGQSSALTLPDGNITFAYAPGDSPVVRLTPSSAAPDSDVLIDIRGQNVTFVPGETVVGMGTADIVTRDVEVLSPTRLLAAVTVREEALPGSYMLSVTSGLQVVTAAAAFRVLDNQPPDDQKPLVRFGGLVNSATLKPELSPGVRATLFGKNLVANSGLGDLARSQVSVTLNGQRARLFDIQPGRIRLHVPVGVEPGRAVLLVNNGAAESEPILVRISRASPGLFRVVHRDQSAVDSGNPARPEEELALVATGLGRGFFLERTANDGVSAISTAYLIVDQVRVKPVSIQPVPNEPGLFLVGFHAPRHAAGGAFAVSLLVDGFRGNTLQVRVAAPGLTLR